jgi:hypothetical protein
MGFYATSKPVAYTVKQRETDELLIATLNAAPSLDATSNPPNGSALHNIAQAKDGIMKAVDANGFPPKLLLKYGHSVLGSDDRSWSCDYR